MRRWQLAACLAAVGAAVTIGFFVAPALVKARPAERGQEEAPQAGAATANGTIIGVEKQKQPVAGAKEPVEVAILNLWCADGMRAFKLPEVQRVRFLNPVIEGELKKALETLALSHDTQKKAVSVRCVG